MWNLRQALAELTEPLSVLKLADDTTHKRLRVGLRALESGTVPVGLSQTDGELMVSPAVRLRNVAFGIDGAFPGALLPDAPRVREAAQLSAEDARSLHTQLVSDAKLNAGQEQAIEFAMRAPELACIHGPPGTVSAAGCSAVIASLTVCPCLECRAKLQPLSS